MTASTAIESIWQAHRQGDHFPEEWRGRLSVEDAYRVQLGLLERHLAGGARQSGWKAGLTGDKPRQAMGSEAPVFGYLLAGNRYASGHAFRFADFRQPAVESEVLVTLSADLAGPGVTPERAREAVATVAPAFEIVERRGGGLDTDLALGIADDVMQAAYVAGEAMALPADLDLHDLRLEVVVDGAVEHTLLGREVMDPPLASLAWLANTLPAFGQRLRAGQEVLTGSFTRPLPAAAGQRWESRFDALGTVTASFA